MVFLQHNTDYGGEGGPVLPLGNRGGVPPRAADVDLAACLRGKDALAARQVLEPRALLLPAHVGTPELNWVEGYAPGECARPEASSGPTKQNRTYQGGERGGGQGLSKND